jgi:NADH:ubiquinone oxidoreductase subunit 5 (subunit L)/multisubunit Na+/H+ antiporter MnhA subunit
MMLPLAVLAIGAIGAGFLNWPGGGLSHFLGKSPSFELIHKVSVATYGAQNVDPVPMGQPSNEPHTLFNMVMLVSFIVAALGIFTAYVFHLRDRARADRLAAGMPGVTSLLDRKFWVDEVYQGGVVEPLRNFGRGLWMADRFGIDGLVAAISLMPQAGGWVLKLGVQRGSLQGYAAAMLFGVVVILVLVFM